MHRPLRLVIDSSIPYIRQYAERLGKCVYLPGKDISSIDIRHADALIVRTRTRCDRALLEKSDVRFIATATIGYDHLDTVYLEEKGIVWKNAPGCNASSVVQYVESALFRAELAGLLCLEQATVGVVGVGNIGHKVADMLRRHGCRILCNDPPRQASGDGGFCTLEELANECDVITLHTPLTDIGEWPTRHLISEDFFSCCKKHPLLLNTARGGVVDEKALVSALQCGIVRAAIIDTWENEPHILSPLLQAAFIATPHVAGYSADGKAAATRMVLEATARFFNIPIEFDVRLPALPADFRYDTEGDFPPCEALRLYDPVVDSRRLKEAPTDFERLRTNYPLRREVAS